MSIEHMNDYRLDLVHANWIIVKSDVHSIDVVIFFGFLCIFPWISGHWIHRIIREAHELFLIQIYRRWTRPTNLDRGFRGFYFARIYIFWTYLGNSGLQIWKESFICIKLCQLFDRFIISTLDDTLHYVFVSSKIMS